MGRWKLLRASKFWKLPAQLASTDFSQSFTPDVKNMERHITSYTDNSQYPSSEWTIF